MKSNLRTLTKIVLTPLLIALLTVSIGAATGPTLPNQFFGNVTVDGAEAPDGLEVVAKINGVEKATNITGSYDGFDYNLIVPGNDNDTITFYVAGEQATTHLLENGESTNLDLSVNDTTAPTASITADKTSIKTGDSVTFNASGSSDNIGIASYSWDFGDGVNATGPQVNHEYSSAGTYIVKLTVADAAGNTANATVSIKVERVSTGGGGAGGGGGGGGGGGAAEPLENVDIKESAYASFQPGKNVSKNFTKTMAIVGLDISLQTTTSDTRIVVEELKPGVEHSDLVSEPAPGLVYKNFNIWVGTAGTASEENTQSAKIRFRVDKQWTQDNDIPRDHVYLYRWSDDQWNQLPTTYVEEAGGYYVYEASTPGFSPFAIAGETPSEATPTPTTTATPKATVTATPTAAEKPWSIPGFTGGLAIVGLLGAAYVLYRRG